MRNRAVGPSHFSAAPHDLSLSPLRIIFRSLGRLSLQCRAEKIADDVGGAPQRIGVEVGLTRGGLWLRIAEQATDDGQAQTGAGADRREGVAQVVQPHAVALVMPPHCLQGLLGIGARAISLVEPFSVLTSIQAERAESRAAAAIEKSG